LLLAPRALIASPGFFLAALGGYRLTPGWITDCAQQSGEEFECVMYAAMRNTNLKYRAGIF
jgi:hypothetical protein